MAMALKADVRAACKAEGTNKPVDLVHLSSMTMGDRALESQVLSVFATQSQIYLASWQQADGHNARKQAAHSMKGAARGIGAWEVADLAEAAEQPGFDNVDALAAAVGRVCDYIDELSRAES